MRRRSLFALAVALTLVLPMLPAEAGKPKRSPPKLTFTRPLQVEAHDVPSAILGNGERQGSGEPSIKVDSKGIIYLSGVTTVGRASPVWFSQNNGQSFEILHTPAQFRELSPLGAEGDIAIADDDAMYFVDTGISFLAFSRWAAATGEHGEQPDWEYTIPHTIGVLPGLDDRPWLAYGSDESEEVLWLYVNHGSHTATYKSTDGGMTWSEMNNTLPTQRYFPGMIAAPRDSTQDAYVFGDCGTGNTLCSNATHDGGATWEEVEVAKVEEGRSIAPLMVSSAVDDAGVAYGAWAEADTNDASEDAPNPSQVDGDDGCDVYYAASRDGGRTWGRKVRVSDGKGCAVFPWITGGARGRVALAWYEADAPIAHADAAPTPPPGAPPGTEAKPATWYLNAGVVLNADRRPQIVRGVADPNPVHYGPLLRELWDFLQIAVGPDGRFHIAYVEDVTAGPNGPVGLGPPDDLQILGAQAPKDTMYVAQRGGPRLRDPPMGERVGITFCLPSPC